eukprot:s239_g19.t1
MNDQGSPIFDLWRQWGWRSAQEFAEQHWGQPRQFTCKHSTECDMVWLSPEAIAMCEYVDIAEVFAEHATVTVGLNIPSSLPATLTWSRPSRVPWTSVDSSWISSTSAPSWSSSSDADAAWAEWASTWETSLDGFIPHQPHRQLLPQQRGRLQQTQPKLRANAAMVLKPSRPSEVCLRNDLIGTEVKLWFRQLRRLQSYAAAIAANKQTPAALAYRLELWTSILRSPGFALDFASWWRLHRLHSLPDSPPLLPAQPPDASTAAQIFATFKLNFEAFESWHLRQRGLLLKAKYEKGLNGIFLDLKPPRRERLDSLTQQQSFTVLAVDSESGQLHLDSPVVDLGFSSWFFEDQRITPTVINEVVLQLPDVSNLAHGDVLTRSSLISSTHELHQSLLDFWTPTWKAMAEVDAATWSRVLSFFQHHVPQFHFDPGPIDPTSWRRALKKYKATAARGVDGVSHEDLLALPPAWTQRLLQLLHDIELGRSTWPSAILYGVVSVLSKNEGAATVDRFRPVVIFSIIYRTWARVRSKQLLRWLAPRMDVEAYGFLPGCEPSQLWLLLQAEVEVALQCGGQLCGLSTDLVRAFNFIPRPHTYKLASHLGVPSTILRAWSSFLDNCTRAFDIRGALSVCTSSTCGLPEGDAMSVYGMTQLSFAWHLYMRAFCPPIRSLSFIDNLSVIASNPAFLAQGLACILEFYRLWNMSIDEGKSYCWALTDDHKRLLITLPIQRVDHAHELGGVLSFTKRRFTGLQQQRVAKLPVKWKRLQASQAPLHMKLSVIPVVFWASALHGINGSCMGETHIDSLRTQALRACKISKAGVNGLLRLSLSSTPAADPGWWRLRLTITSFARLLRKEPRLLMEWKCFMSGFDGTLFSGPFSQMLVVLNQIQWRIEPPFLIDHDNCGFDLMQLDEKQLLMLLYDGWLQLVARVVSSRKTMVDLEGLDPLLLRAVGANLTGLQAALLSSLQSGAFLDQAMQAHFDMSKTGICPLCGVPDSALHWLSCPRFEALRSTVDNWQDHHSSDTLALKIHLLPSRSPYAVKWKQMLLQVPDLTTTFLSQPGPGIQHIFTDGSATSSRAPFQLAAGGCINASTGALVMMTHVFGICQSSDRAELVAILGALEWQCHFDVNVHLWTDSKFAADGLNQILQYGVTEVWSHQDLWDRIYLLLQQLGQRELVPHWIPSHLDASRTEDPSEDWALQWNDRIDIAVGLHNRCRSHELQQLRQQALAHHCSGLERMRQLRSFFFKIAEQSAATQPEAPESENVSLFGFVPEPHCSLNDLYIPSVEAAVDGSLDRPFDLPIPFVVSLITTLIGRSADDSGVYPLSFEELSLWMIRDFQIAVPFRNAKTGELETHMVTSRFERPTLSYVLRYIRKAVSWFCRDCLDSGEILFDHFNKVDLGIFRPAAGIYVRLLASDVQRCHSLIREYTRSRAIRKILKGDEQVEYKFLELGDIKWEDPEGKNHVLKLEEKDVIHRKDGVKILLLPVERWEPGSEKKITSYFYQGVTQGPEGPAISVSQVLNQLFVGSCPRKRSHIDDLKRRGITAVFNLQTEDDCKGKCIPDIGMEKDPLAVGKIYESEGMEYHWRPTADMDPPSRAEMLPEVSFLLAQLLHKGHKVYCHCNAGVGRSPAAVCGYLTFVLGLSLREMQHVVASSRPVTLFDLWAIEEARPHYKAHYAADAEATAVQPQVEQHHGVKLTPEAVRASVRGSRALRGRFLPDRALDVLDDAATLASAQADASGGLPICTADFPNAVTWPSMPSKLRNKWPSAPPVFVTALRRGSNCCAHVSEGVKRWRIFGRCKQRT